VYLRLDVRLRDAIQHAHIGSVDLRRREHRLRRCDDSARARIGDRFTCSV